MLSTKRKGNALELLCSSCDLAYAEVLPDRLLIYSLHYGKSHTSAFDASELRVAYEVAQANGFLKLECSCGRLPCAVVQFKRLVIKSQHKATNWQTHSNALMLEDLAEICNRISPPNDIILSD